MLPLPTRDENAKTFWDRQIFLTLKDSWNIDASLSERRLRSAITIFPKDIEQPEQLGSKEKFWCRINGNDSRWLFKYSRLKTGEHWSEKVASRLADLLKIRCAKVEIAEFDGRIGCISETILSRGMELIHGNQILNSWVSDYDANLSYKQNKYTMDNIVHSLRNNFSRSPEAFNKAQSDLFSYFIFDVLIGNTDRHHENWAISRWKFKDEHAQFISPSFDHASSLGRELVDKSFGRCRCSILKTGSMGSYANRARGAIYLSENAPKPASLREMSYHLMLNDHSYISIIYDRICSLQSTDFVRILDDVPDRYMSEISKEFSLSFLNFNLASLREMKL